MTWDKEPLQVRTSYFFFCSATNKVFEGGAVAVVVVVCVGFLLVLLVIGVLKMRDTPLPKRHRKQRKPVCLLKFNLTLNHTPADPTGAGNAMG